MRASFNLYLQLLAWYIYEISSNFINDFNQCSYFNNYFLLKYSKHFRSRPLAKGGGEGGHGPL